MSERKFLMREGAAKRGADGIAAPAAVGEWTERVA
jgi:hypothetical protein